MKHNSIPDYDALGNGIHSNKTADELFSMALPSGPEIDWYAIEEPWTLKKGGYSRNPEGDPVELAREVIDFLEKR